jgi:formyltetrahydrofolate-dependent phosphoribosylglycinamide formyltransferase
MRSERQGHEPLPLAVLISGGGTTLRNLLERIGDGSLPAEVRLVISSTAQAGGLDFAREAGIPFRVARRKDFATPEEYREAIFQPCRDAGVELVVMGGFLKHVLIPPDFEQRVMNIHPGLIPAFCGQGFFGHHVHQAVLDYGAKISGCTVHFADNQYDHGPIIVQRTVPVLDDDTPQTLAARVFAQECEAYPEAIRLLAEGRLEVDGRRVRVKPAARD